jgi:hypothetical protein
MNIFQIITQIQIFILELFFNNLLNFKWTKILI